MAVIFIPGRYDSRPPKKRIHPVLWVIFAIILYCAYQKDEENLRKKQQELQSYPPAPATPYQPPTRVPDRAMGLPKALPKPSSWR